MEPLLVVCKITVSPGTEDSLIFHSNLFYDQFSAIAFGNAQITV